MFHPRFVVLLLLALALPAATVAAEELPYVQEQNVVYGESHGVGLVMDIFRPTGKANGLGVVDVISGAWRSDRGKLRDHERAQIFKIFGEQGYTVFAVRPGSITKFSVPEMLSNLQEGIAWVKSHGEKYAIDGERLGLMGASAGGHLACLAAVSGEGEAPVRAVAVFFPPTDFLDFGGKALGGDDELLGRLLGESESLKGQRGDASERLKQISPAHLVTSKAPPFLLIHGDADPLVPLQQSERMLAALREAGVPAELIVKKGGGHPWFTIHEEVKVVADWFDKELKAE